MTFQFLLIILFFQRISIFSFYIKPSINTCRDRSEGPGYERLPQSIDKALSVEKWGADQRDTQVKS